MITIRFTSAIALSAMLAGCGSQSVPIAPISPASATAVPQSPSTSTTLAYGAKALIGATQTGPYVGTAISVLVHPHLRDSAGLATYAALASQPGSAVYHKFLTPSQIADRFGASPQTYTAAINYFTARGLKVASFPQRLDFVVSGSTSSVASAFNTTFAQFGKGTQSFYAPATVPHVPSSLGIDAADLTSFAHTQSQAIHLSGTSGSQGLTPLQLASAYDYQGAYAAGYTGKGITIGIIGTGPVNTTDVPTFKSDYGVGGSGAVTFAFLTTSPYQAPPEPSAPCTSGAGCIPEDGEAQLDTEQASSLAYDANVLYYYAYNPATFMPGAVDSNGVGAEISQAVADNKADILSISIGGPESGTTAPYDNELAAAVTEGIAIFVSSGDDGAEGCQPYPNTNMQDALCISYPASNPNVVAVGGTNTPLGLNNQLAGPITGWGTQTQNGAGPSGSGGGVSTLYTQPTYQNGVVSSSDRTVPDVSANADLETGDAVLTNSGSGEGGPNINQVGGTSAAAPDLAAMWALVLQACAQSASCATGSGAKPYRAGNPDYSFYTAYKNKTAYAAAFYDVLYGSNAEFPECYYSGSCPAGTTEDPGYAAMTGYDLVTGIGAPYARNLIKALVGV